MNNIVNTISVSSGQMVQKKQKTNEWDYRDRTKGL